MEAVYKDFIGMYKNIYPDGYCNHMIEEFERVIKSGYAGNRQDAENVAKTKKEDYFYFLNLKNHCFSPFNEVNSTNLFLMGCKNALKNIVLNMTFLEILI